MNHSSEPLNGHSTYKDVLVFLFFLQIPKKFEESRADFLIIHLLSWITQLDFICFHNRMDARSNHGHGIFLNVGEAFEGKRKDDLGVTKQALPYARCTSVYTTLKTYGFQFPHFWNERNKVSTYTETEGLNSRVFCGRAARNHINYIKRWITIYYR